MSFVTDKQTLDDLNLTGKYKSGSVFSFFNQTKTGGGQRLMEFMFNNPLTDVAEINTRSSIFKYFQLKSLKFPFSSAQFAVMENYLGGRIESNLLLAGLNNLSKQVLASLVKDEQYGMIQKGVLATTGILKACYRFFNELEQQSGIKEPYHEQIMVVKGILNKKHLQWLKTENELQQIPFLKLIRYDHLFRHTLQDELTSLIRIMYELDVFIAVSDLARANNFSYASALPSKDNLLSVDELRHPSLTKAVGNTVSFHQDSNVIFLTGANMAGKSTIMKTLGLSVYLAHMGFPVAARTMKFSLRDGIYSSINVPDNLDLGLSHFYAEVMRVKKVAEEVASGKDLLVIFDELFKGTNVKDAFDATRAVTQAFSSYRNCFFIISTHIIEVGEALKGNDLIQFLYLPTVMEGNVPRYTYKLEKGITSDRQGMTIIENEKIMELLD